MNPSDKDKELNDKFGSVTTSNFMPMDNKGASGFGPQGNKSQFNGNFQNQGMSQSGYQAGGISGKMSDIPQGFGLQKASTMTKQQIKVDPYQTIFSCTDEEINEIFQAFQNNGEVNLDDFAGSLDAVGYSKKCSLLTSKIETWRLQNRKKTANEKEFKSFFRFDLRDEKDFKFVFELMIQGTKDPYISRRTLQGLNQDYGLGFTSQDIDLMINNLNKGNQDAVYMKELHTDLYKNPTN